jgi:hypothetical protein
MRTFFSQFEVLPSRIFQSDLLDKSIHIRDFSTANIVGYNPATHGWNIPTGQLEGTEILMA